MPKQEWYRRSTWSPEDQAEYFAKLNRARAASRPQYLQIQASHLAIAGLHRQALTLLDRYFQDYPGDLFAANGHFAQAQLFIALGDEAAAITAFRNALSAERRPPHVGSNVWLSYPEFIVQRWLHTFYQEAEQILNEFYSESKLAFPALRFQYHFVRAFLADQAKNLHERNLHATNAIAASNETHSGFRYHAKEGLVTTIPSWQAELLEKWCKNNARQPAFRRITATILGNSRCTSCHFFSAP